MIADQATLRAKCQDWQRCPALGIDTEFVRERTFFPQLGLIQVSDGTEPVLIDPLAIDDLSPLGEVLTAPGVTKIFHSCGEDLEVFYHHFGTFPRPLFDTQIAAAFAGHGSSLGYARLVHQLFEVELTKGETRSRWLKRPLTEAQKVYAAQDVAFLVPAFERLRQELRALDREDWAHQETQRLANPRRFLPEPDEAYLGLARSRGLGHRGLAVLQALCAWRERAARKRDLPRNFVLRKEVVLDIARRQPADMKSLGAIRGLTPAVLGRTGPELLALIQQVCQQGPASWPARPPELLDLKPHRQQVDRWRKKIAEHAEELGIPTELLANRKTAERLARRALQGREPWLPGTLSPWRRAELEGLLENIFDSADEGSASGHPP